ncbi:MAG: TIGR03936 family radical SAM-associated protein [Syntrophomonadaceae bacterium]
MRLRAEYSVGPDLRFLSNLDMMNLMARALRRSQVPYALSEGFNPHIRLSMGTVLPVGLWGKREYFDLETSLEIKGDDFIEKMNQSLPGNIRIKDCRAISVNTPTLMKSINCACYSFILDIPVLLLQEWKDRLLQQEKLVVKSRGKKKDLDKDLKPGILNLEINGWQDLAIVDIWGTTGEPLNIRFDELRDLLITTGINQDNIIDIYRSGNFIRLDNRYYTPLEKVKLFG